MSLPSRKCIRRRKECFLGILAIALMVGVFVFIINPSEDGEANLVLDEPLTDGRTEDDGTWYTQTYPYHFHLYSAFYDNRTTLKSGYSHLRIIVVMEEFTYNYNLYCEIYFPRVTVIRAQKQFIGAGVQYGEKLYREYILTCDLPRDDPPPKSVTITNKGRTLNVTRIPVEIPQHPDLQQDLAVCVSVSYYELKPDMLIEWLEMQKVLGVSTVFIYNNSITGQANEILSSYVDEGFVVVRHSFSFVPDPDELLIHLHMSPVINDCMYRNMFSYRYFAIFDLDEFVVPRQHKFLPDMIRDLPNMIKAERVGSYVFRNAYFFFDLAPSSHDKMHSPSIFLKHQRRLRPSPPEYSIKSIVDSQACTAMHNHYCLKYTHNFMHEWTPLVNVPPKVALLHHYKWCHLDSFLDSPESCAEVMKFSVIDNIIRRYRHELLQNLNKQLIRFGLS